MSLKNGANVTDQAQIKKLFAAGQSIAYISAFLNIKESCITSFVAKLKVDRDAAAEAQKVAEDKAIADAAAELEAKAKAKEAARAKLKAELKAEVEAELKVESKKIKPSALKGKVG